MNHVYLIAAEPDSAATLQPLLAPIGAKALLSCAWVLPWNGTVESLRSCLRAHLPRARFVLSEVNGGGWSLP